MGVIETPEPVLAEMAELVRIEAFLSGLAQSCADSGHVMYALALQRAFAGVNEVVESVTVAEIWATKKADEG